MAQTTTTLYAINHLHKQTFSYSIIPNILDTEILYRITYPKVQIIFYTHPLMAL